MRLTVEDCLAAIETHTRGLAEAASGRLDARIEHCPDWTMADLVWHVIEVHQFWEFVARTLPQAAPGDRPAAERPDDAELVAGLLLGMATLVDTLRAADQDAGCWTWGLEENVRFITRHQVQEAAVHHWDAVNAAGTGSWWLDSVAAIDAVEEFLAQSVANERWPMPEAEPLGGTLWFCACGDTETDESPTWVISDGAPGTLITTVHETDEVGPEIVGPAAGGHGPAQGFLLWLYRRIELADVFSGDLALVTRFRAFTNTD